MGLTAPHLRRRGRSSLSSETAFSSNLKGCFMATLMMVMFLFVSHIGTSPNNNNNKRSKSTNALRKDGQQQQQQSLRNFDPDQIGVIHLSASENDDGIDAKESNKHNDNNKIPKQDGEEDDEGNDDNVDDDNTDDDDTHFFWDIDEFERDADLLDTKSRFDDFVDHLQSAMDEQLLSLQPDIDGRIQMTMKPTKTDLEDINRNKVDTNVRVQDDDFQKLVTNIENKFREKLYNEIHSQSNEVMEDLIIDMEAAMDLNEEYEEEDGDGEPIDLDAEEEDLMVQAVTAVDEIVQDVLNTNMAQMVFEVMYGQLQQLFKETFGKQRKIVIDIDKKEWKVNGWHENLPPTPPPTPEPEEQKKKNEDEDDEDNKKEDSNKETETKENDTTNVDDDDDDKDNVKEETKTEESNKEPENKNDIITNDNNDQANKEESEKKNKDDVKEPKTKQQGESTTPQESSKDVEQTQPKQDEEQKEEVVVEEKKKDTDSKTEEEKTPTVDKKEEDEDEDTTEGK